MFKTTQPKSISTFRVLVNDTQESPKAAVSFKEGAGPYEILFVCCACCCGLRRIVFEDRKLAKAGGQESGDPAWGDLTLGIYRGYIGVI